MTFIFIIVAAIAQITNMLYGSHNKRRVPRNNVLSSPEITTDESKEGSQITLEVLGETNNATKIVHVECNDTLEELMARNNIQFDEIHEKMKNLERKIENM